MNSHEKQSKSPERKINQKELEEAGAERYQELHEQHEQRAEKHETVDDARQEIERVTYERHQDKHEEKEHQPSPDHAINSKDREASFNTTMKEVQSQMSAPSRAFSKIIHNKVVEKTSEAVGGTVARPNALLSGAVVAFVLTLGVYLIAKNLGYPLSGFETIAAFVIGWLIGLGYDFVRVMVTGRRS